MTIAVIEGFLAAMIGFALGRMAAWTIIAVIEEFLAAMISERVAKVLGVILALLLILFWVAVWLGRAP